MERGPTHLFLAGLCGSIVTVAALSGVPRAASAQGTETGVERLYVLNCGEGVAGDISRWSPGVNVGKSMEFVDNCYLIKHGKAGCCGIPASPTRSPRCREVRRQPIPARRTGAGRRRSRPSSSKLGVKPSDIQYVAVSHTHRDHVGNVDDVPAVDAAGAESRVRLAGPIGAAASSRSSR